MRKSSILGLILAICAVPLTAWAQITDEVVPTQELLEQATMGINAPEEPTQSALTDAGAMTPTTGQQLKDVKAAAARPASITRSKTKSVTSVADLAGEYVMTYSTLISYGSDGGKGVTISQIEGTDSILITNFWDTGIEAKALVDISAMTISLPNQVLGSSTTYGEYDLAVCTSSAAPDRTSAVEGTISTDGTITITSWWGVFVTSGTYADQYFGLYYNTELEAANTTMSYQVYASSTDTYTTNTFNVVVEQTASNVVTVKNFGNFGQTVEISLTTDSVATIGKQLVRDDYTNGDWYCYSVVYKDDWSGLSSYSYPITCDSVTDLRKISWGAWNMICTSYFYGYITSGWVDLPFDLQFPSFSTTSFEGEGTEESPYLIKSLDDLVYLSDCVNNSENLVYGSTLKHASEFRGQYFRVENDIDMGNYRFTPIGSSYYYRFGGTFDGNGKTISGLYVNTGSSGYAGLFGRCDTTSVIKNITMSSPYVTTTGYYAGAIAGYSYGSISNCHITGATIDNEGYTGSGGITALVIDISDCSVTNSTITGTGGYAAGVAGQVNGTISNCYVTNTTINAGGLSSSYPSGGVAGSLYYGNAENCYFAGTVDGTSTTGLYLGGIAGNCYHGSISKCFSTGNVLGYYSTAIVGGVVGSLTGSVSNSYSTGRVYGYASYYSGGITGYVNSYTSDNTTVQSSLTNCYTASPVTAETYLYDGSTERREALGYIADGTSPEITNIYFDKQVVNFGSTEYGATTAELTAASGPSGFDASVWTFTEGYYPRLTGMHENEAALFSASAIQLGSTSSATKVVENAKLNLLGSTYARYLVGSTLSTEGYYSKIEGDSIKVSTDIGADTLYLIYDGIGSKYYFLKIAPVPFDGMGTEDDPYLISTKQDLIDLADYTTNIGQYFPETYFLMTNDIDLEKDTTFVGICTDSDDAHCQFAGNFNGGGHTIHNMRLPDALEWTTRPEDSSTGLGTPNSSATEGYKGFIGRLATSGVVRNLTTAADCELSELWAETGAIVGYNYGLVDSCSNYANVSTYSCWVGGVVGYNTSSGTVSNCYNGGDVKSGYMYAGGIAGTNHGLIKNCQNAGDVYVTRLSAFISADSRLNLAGGISGSTSGGRFENCVNMGSVSAYTKVGGISATLASSSSGTYTNDVINCINYGTLFTVTDDENVGEIGGTSGTTGELADNYYDGQITLHKAHGNLALSNTTAVETSTLTSGTALENYSTDVWDFTSGSYPVLKAFTDHEATKVKRSIIIGIATGETVANLKSNVTLSSDNDCTWALRDGSIFSISGSTLIVPDSVSKVAVDTLVATAGSYTKKFVIKATPTIPLEGEGTAESPYIISTTSEWNDFADYVTDCADDLNSKYVKLTADLDFSSTSLSTVSSDRMTPFNGDFNGDSHTISGFSVTADDSYYGALFTVTGDNANIHDLTVEGTVSAAYTYAGGVVGELGGTMSNVVSKVALTTTKSYSGGLAAYVDSEARLTDCSFAGTVKSSATYAAGLVGYSSTGVYYERCYNTGSVTYSGTTAKSYTSGLIAYCYPDTLIDCYNTGSVTASSSSAGGLGGLIGLATSANGGDPYYITGCYNTADISSLCDNAGLIMSLNTSGYSKLYMEDCYNSGNITSTSTAAKSSTYTSGLVNTYSGGTMRNCVNYGDVTSVTPVYCGGLLGYYKGSRTEDARMYITNCANYGAITATGNQGGGIIAYSANYVTIDSCFNLGTITGGFGLGGIAGCFTGTSSVMQNCWNAASVSGTNTRIGGLIGYNSTNATVTSCFNVGSVSAPDALGAGGIAGQGGSNFSNVYNAGTVSGYGRVGGLIGYPVKNNTTVTSSYVSGTVAESDSTGMIIGIHMANGNTLWNTGNSVTSTYYLSELEVSDRVDTVGTAISRAALATLDLGDGWYAGDDYTYPTLPGFTYNDYAKVYAAAIIPADGDTYSSITKGFNIGVPDGVTWSAMSTSADMPLEINGNSVTFTEPFTGTIILTATSGDVSLSTTLTCAVTTVGIQGISGNGRTLVEEQFYTPSGTRVAEPANGQKAIYIVVKNYSDGTREVVKEAR